MTNTLASPNFHGDLGDGLIRRWSTSADVEKLAHLMGTVFRDSADEPLNVRMIDQAHLMMAPGYPYMGPGDFAIVEDTSKPDSPLVACTALWRHQWSYAGLPFGVGRPEYVAANADYRKRGLVRAVFEMVHARSAAEGHLLQAITGIPYFYRQFGYEYVLDLGGRRITYLSSIPNKKGDDPEPYSLRPATFDDIPHLMALYDQGRAQSLVWYEGSEEFWRFMIGYWENPAVRERDIRTVSMGTRLQMIVNNVGEVCGYLAASARRGGGELHIRHMAFYPQINLQAALPALLRAMRDLGMALPTMQADTPPLSALSFDLGRHHPIYTVLGETLAPRFEPPYAWYIRIPDLVAFIRHIAPFLEARLAASVLAGQTGELKLDLYRSGLRLQFADGKLVEVEPWRAPTYGDNAGAGCPPLVLLQLLLGYRSLEELKTSYPDVWTNHETNLLLNTLFPIQYSNVVELG